MERGDGIFKCAKTMSCDPYNIIFWIISATTETLQLNFFLWKTFVCKKGELVKKWKFWAMYFLNGPLIKFYNLDYYLLIETAFYVADNRPKNRSFHTDHLSHTTSFLFDLSRALWIAKTKRNGRLHLYIKRRTITEQQK